MQTIILGWTYIRGLLNFAPGHVAGIRMHKIFFFSTTNANWKNNNSRSTVRIYLRHFVIPIYYIMRYAVVKSTRRYTWQCKGLSLVFEFWFCLLIFFFFHQYIYFYYYYSVCDDSVLLYGLYSEKIIKTSRVCTRGGKCTADKTKSCTFLSQWTGDGQNCHMRTKKKKSKKKYKHKNLIVLTLQPFSSFTELLGLCIVGTYIK